MVLLFYGSSEKDAHEFHEKILLKINVNKCLAGIKLQKTHHKCAWFSRPPSNISTMVQTTVLPRLIRLNQHYKQIWFPRHNPFVVTNKCLKIMIVISDRNSEDVAHFFILSVAFCFPLFMTLSLLPFIPLLLYLFLSFPP